MLALLSGDMCHEDVLKEHAELSKISGLNICVILFLVSMSFIQMSFGALLILEQFPETNWVFESLMASF